MKHFKLFLISVFVLQIFFPLYGLHTQVESTVCQGTLVEASEGEFEIGYNFQFNTVGTTVTASFEMLDEKVGIVAFLWNHTNGFEETQMLEDNGVFSLDLTDQTIGTELLLSCKFAFAGGYAVTKQFNYVVGNNCEDETPEVYNITYENVSPDEHLNSSTYTKGSVVTLRNAYRDGSIFNGWFTDAEFTTQISRIDTDATGDITVYAKWTETTNTPCQGALLEASEGEFEVGYNYQFSTAGTTVTASFEMLDEKVGLVAFLWNHTNGFEETQMLEDNGVFSLDLTDQTIGTELLLSCKFAFAGGQAVTKQFNYIVGNNCEDGTPATYNITYENVIDTEHSNPPTYTKGLILPLTNAYRDGFLFDGWYTDIELTDEITQIGADATGDITVYAKWSESTNTPCKGMSSEASEGEFEVGYNYEFNTVGTTVTVSFEMLDEKVGLVAFLWNQTNGFEETQMVDNGGVFSLDLTEQTIGAELLLTCKFAFAGGATVTKQFSYVVGDNCGDEIPETYNITYENVIPSEHSNPSTYTKGTILTFSNAHRDGFLFDGWYTDVELTNEITEIAADATGDITVYAKWSESTNTPCEGTSSEALEGEFEVGYNYEFNTVGTTVTVSFEMLDEEVGVVAFLWNQTNGFEEIQMVDNGGVFSLDLTEQTIGAELLLTCKFAFAGGAAVTKQFSYIVGDNCEGDIPETYNVTYENVIPSEHSNPSSYIEGETIVLSDAVREGFLFDGWYTDVELTNEITEIGAGETGDITIYAKWLEIFTITYVDGYMHENPSSYVEGETVVLLDAIREGHEFNGWFTDSEFTESINEITTGNISVYAKWTEVITGNDEKGRVEVYPYPNPVLDELYIDAIISELKIYSVEGVLIKHFEKNLDSYDLSTLLKGVYIVYFTVDTIVYQYKIVKQ